MYQLGALNSRLVEFSLVTERVDGQLVKNFIAVMHGQVRFLVTLGWLGMFTPIKMLSSCGRQRKT